jgi:hypothetical protein
MITPGNHFLPLEVSDGISTPYKYLNPMGDLGFNYSIACIQNHDTY